MSATPKILTEHPLAVCPCCGASIEGRIAPKDILSFIHVSETERRILNYLIPRFGRQVWTNEIADSIYSNDPEGGPVGANKVISVLHWKLRQKLHPLGLTIKGFGGGRGLRDSGQAMLCWRDDARAA